MKLYHGSSKEILIPDLSMSRIDIDFGPGFYMTEDKRMASKWACSKNESVLNTYNLDLCNLKVKELKLDKEWLHYIMANRTGDKMEYPTFDDKEYDVIIGATADDKLFNIVDMYNDGLISAENAVKVMNCMNYSNQIVLKTPKAIDKLEFLYSHELYGYEKQQLRQMFRDDGREANRHTKDLLREINGR